MDRTIAFKVMKLDMKIDGENAKSELKKNFVRLSRLLHPDKCPLDDAKAAFQARVHHVGLFNFLKE